MIFDKADLEGAKLVNTVITGKQGNYSSCQGFHGREHLVTSRLGGAKLVNTEITGKQGNCPCLRCVTIKQLEGAKLVNTVITGERSGCSCCQFFLLRSSR